MGEQYEVGEEEGRCRGKSRKEVRGIGRKRLGEDKGRGWAKGKEEVGEKKGLGLGQQR